MEHAARTKLLAEFICSSEAKVGDGDAVTAIEAEDILWLQITVIDTERMAVLDCFKELKEYVLDESVFPKVPTTVQNLREQIMIRCVVQDDVCVAIILDNPVKRNNARVSRRNLVQRNLANVSLPPLGRRLSLRVREALDGERLREERASLDRSINYAVSTDT